MLWLQGEITADAAGPVDLRIAAPEGSEAWLGGTRLDLASTAAVPLAKGANKLIFRVPVTRGGDQEIRAEVRKTKDSPRRVDVAGGP
jgi:hypothetical protein